MKYSVFILLSSLLIISCQEDEDTNNFGLPASLVQFSASEATSKEGSGHQEVKIYLDRPQEGKTLVDFSVGGNITPSTSSVKGDVKVITASPLIIEAGETEGIIEFEILEDKEFEAEPESISITLNSIITGNAQLSSSISERNYRHHIQENEYELALQWDQTDESPSNVDLVVELPNNAVQISENIDGSEKLVLNNVRENDSYLVTVWYYEGESSIDYDVLFRKAGSKSILLQEGSFQTGEANREFSLTNGQGTRHYKMVCSGTDLQLVAR
uniref:Calx-beta domain-containing protein n=1 Tax=Roseihalotalea indica TaxID=2867963 RepID=A0AA49GLH1_9BACT|nr:hypothetical protein K4G66_28615 [Tunicatimonas sp. TK19036]